MKHTFQTSEASSSIALKAHRLMGTLYKLPMNVTIYPRTFSASKQLEAFFSSPRQSDRIEPRSSRNSPKVTLKNKFLQHSRNSHVYKPNPLGILSGSISDSRNTRRVKSSGMRSCWNFLWRQNPRPIILTCSYRPRSLSIKINTK